jgi:hypothetical protein
MYGLRGPDVGENPDRWMAQRLREIDYDLAHPEVQILADHLEAFAVGTLVNMKKSNELLGACKKLIMCELPPPPESWNCESQRLIVVSVKGALPNFITRSMRKWEPNKASMTTYFVNYCLLEFKKVYLAYCKEELPLPGLIEYPINDVIPMFETTTVENSAEDRAIARQTIREAINLIGSEEFTDIVRLSAMDRTREQIAKHLGISVSSLDRRIAGYRRKLERGGWKISKGRDGECDRG